MNFMPATSKRTPCWIVSCVMNGWGRFVSRIRAAFVMVESSGKMLSKVVCVCVSTRETLRREKLCI